ncbi:hybrid sensor histidine kinase/response regulator [Bacillus sp. SD088]|uniref:hybrid sensor histidine kinase/response regulator n=1 Tax=Bacillus sp. SD088 TaxID=2782012 RepID=UPI001A972E5F|nr:ATP-binding protein [Bacillus sp. SD088]MBO0991993.1 response regulator [Bacillus sp. SD088]
MSIRKIVFIVSVFFVVLTAFRLLWIYVYSIPDSPKASQGVLDLRNWDDITDYPLTLDGDWEFFPEKFLMEEREENDSIDNNQAFTQVGKGWELATDSSNTYGFGSYRLQILVEPTKGDTYGIRLPYISSSSEIYVNGELLAGAGKVGQIKEEYKPSNKPYTVYFPIENKEEITLVIQVANFDNPGKGGIVRPPKFGLEEPLRENINFSKNIILISCIMYMIHALYSFILFLVGNRDKRFFYFSMMIVCLALGTLIGERLIFEWFPFNFKWGIKVKYLIIISGGFFLLQCIRQQLTRVKLVSIYNILCVFLTLAILLLPAEYNLKFTLFYTIIMLIPCLLALHLMYQVTKQIDKNNIFLLLAIVAAVSSLMWLIILTFTQNEMGPYPFDLLIATICFAIYWFKQYFRILDESQKLAFKLQKEDKRKDTFLQNVAHEMRNPLHGILNISQAVTAREEETLNRKSIEDLNLLNTVGKRMTFLLNDLLELERFKENRIALQPYDISIYGVTEAVISILRFMIEGKSVTLVNRIPKNFPPVFADENRVNQILFNLLHNAIKYTNEGEISVQASVQGEWASISVQDTGKGIEEELLNELFEPYFQATDDMENGFGLGLNISQQLVEMHGGKITIRSKSGEGSIFTFTLKLSSHTQQDTVANIPLIVQERQIASEEFAVSIELENSKNTVESLKTSDHKPIRILVVDDDPINLKVMESIFEVELFHVYTTTNGKQALTMINGHEWDIMIVDVMMPHMSGYELTAHVRERYSIVEMPILLLTAHNRTEDIELGFQVGANDYVTKPVNAPELIARVKSLTSVKQSMSERLRMEAAWLQAQIKPHFILNTFNSIAALSRLDLDRMDKLIHELSNFIHLSIQFQNTDGLSSLENELQLVHSYLFIQKERFRERLRVVWNVDKHIQINIPPLSIQPLVENAIQHGLMKRSEGGEVRISVKDLQKSIVISVADNGVGMKEEAVEQLLDGKRKEGTGIGIFNTDRRLKHLYGQGLKIDSTLEVGTIISFSINKELR